MVEILYHYNNDKKLTHKIQNLIEKKNANLKINKKQFDTFVQLFVKSANELFIDKSAVQNMEHYLLSLELLFIFNDDNLKYKSIKT